MRVLSPLLAGLYLLAWRPDLMAAVDFQKQVQPILRARCQACHGAAQQISGLRLDTKQGALAGGYSGPVIVPGDSAKSKLIDRVTGAKGVMLMPPGGKPLSAEEIAILRQWIDEGASWPESAADASQPAKSLAQTLVSKHWAFQPVANPRIPSAGLPPLSNPIDAFVRQKLNSLGISPSPEAPRHTLARRVYLDLVGLPPTPSQLEEFLSDARPDAYERLVDKLLASPHFGERWARPWLDRARYADSDGYEKDWIRPYAWRYRHWVINALNRDLPFDQFTIEQLAGDLLPQATVEQRVATGFHRQTMTNREGGIDNKQFRFETAVDRVNTTAATWLGLTMACTQCHDHKYDPFTQKDFYQLFAFFEHVEEVDIDAPLPGELEPYFAKRDEYRAERNRLLAEYKVHEQQVAWEKEMLRAAANPGERTDWDLAWDCLLKLTEFGDGEKIIRIPWDKRTQREHDILTNHFIRNYHFAVGPKKYAETKFKELDQKLTELAAKYPQLTQAMTLQEEPSEQPTYLRVRGDYRSLGIPVQPATPAILPPLGVKGRRPNRLDLARWLVSKENPLTARVTVNWVWAELFGRGLVKTLDDFGVRGDPPSHPDLLDHLAYTFREDGWSLKRLIRRIVTSATYKQSSVVRPELKERDPENALLARQNRLRLPAELLRDSALVASGLITHEIGGKSFMPPQPPGVTELGYGAKGWGVGWKESAGAQKYRRGLYIHFQRTTPYPMLMNFDAPKAAVAQCKRERSNTPLQALNLLNDPVFFEAAQALAREVMTGSEDWNGRLNQAFFRVLSRPPSASERLHFEKFYARQKQQHQQGGDSGEVAAWTVLASVLLNVDEFVTRE
ncbi:MAG: PSD1 and planctomycete cytochrome C domain-containing protein [Bryobacteraceae bacterium]|nr:PSD1 and planctomycete cytochrome C domain-containing protein [Bryobacteraceae bacterium]MDW8379394.1 PSD1 and planctomycete cytochrome C domain-containing protein [Bryobacterales bacterium]